MRVWFPSIAAAGNIYRRGARRWRKLYKVNGHTFQAKRFSRVSQSLSQWELAIVTSELITVCVYTVYFKLKTFYSMFKPFFYIVWANVYMDYRKKWVCIHCGIYISKDFVDKLPWWRQQFGLTWESDTYFSRRYSVW